MRTKIFLLILLSLMTIFSVSGQKKDKKTSISDTVMDAANSPIVNAIVMIDNQKTSVVTDSQGNYKVKF